MSASPTRRQKRFQERESKKLYDRIRKETLEQMKRLPEEERENLRKMYEAMNNKQVLTQQEHGM
jgi:hypothetical protein